MLERRSKMQGTSFKRHRLQRNGIKNLSFCTYLSSCWRSNSSPPCASRWSSSSSSSDEMLTTLPRRLWGVLAVGFSLATRLPYNGSCRIFVRRSTTSSSVGVSSSKRSELSSPLRRGGDRGLLGFGAASFGILTRGARQAPKGSPRTCNDVQT